VVVQYKSKVNSSDKENNLTLLQITLKLQHSSKVNSNDNLK
jgi:hypothetical protein